MTDYIKEALAGAIWIMAVALASLVIVATISGGIRAARVETWCAPDQIQWQVIGDFDNRGCESFDRTVTVTLDLEK